MAGKQDLAGSGEALGGAAAGATMGAFAGHLVLLQVV